MPLKAIADLVPGGKLKAGPQAANINGMPQMSAGICFWSTRRNRSLNHRPDGQRSAACLHRG